jgi:serine phosphatase RsbU (regulator of sigma subunit)
MKMSSTDSCAKLVNKLHTALSTDAPNATLKTLNDGLCEASPDGSRCAEVGIMVLNGSDHTLKATAAGDFLPELRTPNDDVVQLDRSKIGVPLGTIPSADYVTQGVELPPKTSVIWVSPYTTQIQNPSGEPYGLNRVRSQFKLARAEPVSIVESIADDITQFIENRGQIEDICIMCFQRTN